MDTQISFEKAKELSPQGVDLLIQYRCDRDEIPWIHAEMWIETHFEFFQDICNRLWVVTDFPEEPGCWIPELQRWADSSELEDLMNDKSMVVDPPQGNDNSMVVDPPQGDIGITVFYNRNEGWINVLTCKVIDVKDIHPISVEIFTYTHDLLSQWIKRASLDANIYIFDCIRSWNRPAR